MIFNLNPDRDGTNRITLDAVKAKGLFRGLVLSCESIFQI